MVPGTAPGGGLADDEFSSSKVNIGFTFTFYGVGYTDLYVNSNGFLDFTDNTATAANQHNQAAVQDFIPSTSPPNGGLIAGWWTDLDPSCSGGSVTSQTTGTAPYRVFTVEYNTVGMLASGCGSGFTSTFQIKLHETYDWIEVVLNNVDNDIQNLEVGIENLDGTDGLEYMRATAPDLITISTGLTVRFYTTNYLWPDGGYRAEQTSLTSYSSIAGLGNQVNLGSDQYSGAQPLGFSFELYGRSYTSAYVNENGIVRLGAASGATNVATPKVLPTAGAPNAMVAGYWADLDASCTGSEIYTYGEGSAPYQRFTIEFKDVGLKGSCTDTVTLQVVLHQTTNAVELRLKDVSSNGALASIGIENSYGSYGHQFGFGTTQTYTNVKVTFQPSFTTRPGTWCDATKHLRYDVIDTSSASNGYAPVGGYPTTYNALSYAFASLAPPTGGGTTIPVTPDEDYWPLPAPSGPSPFPFTLFGETSSDVVVVTNGFLSLDPSYALEGDPFISQALPDPDTANQVVAPLWFNLDLSGGAVYYSITGPAGSRVLTVEWSNAQWAPGGQPLPPAPPRATGYTFQAKLYEAGNIVEFVYPRAYNDATQTYDPELSATFGIESSYDSTNRWQGGVGDVMDATGGFTNYMLRYIPVADAVPSLSPDTYNLDEEATLTVSVTDYDPDTGMPTTGVMANDKDELPCVKKTATLVSSPTHHSSFTFNSDGSFTYTPLKNYYGEDVFSYQVSDGVFTTSAMTVKLLVHPVNDAPEFTKGLNEARTEDNLAPGNGSRAIVVKNWASGINQGGEYKYNGNTLMRDGDATRSPADVPQKLRFHVNVTSGSSLFEVQPRVLPDGFVGTPYSGALPAPYTPRNWGDLTYTLAKGKCGSANLRITLEDDGGTAKGGANESAAQLATITVSCVNDPPTFTPGANVTVPEADASSTAATIPGWATNIEPGPSDESTQKLRFEAEVLTNAWLFSEAPTVSPSATTGGPWSGDLKFRPANDECGSSKVRVSALDNGASTAPSQPRSKWHNVTITVTCIDDAATYTPGNATVSVPYGPAAYTFPAWATGISAGPSLGGRPGDESGQRLRFDAAITNGTASLFSKQPALSPSGPGFAASPWTGDLTFTVAAGQCGKASFRFDLVGNASATVKDHGTVLTIDVACRDATPVNHYNGDPFNATPQLTLDMDTPLVFADANPHRLAVTNIAEGATVTLSVTSGKLKLGNTTGLTGVQDDADVVAFTGNTTTALAAFEGLRYTPATGLCGSIVTMTVHSLVETLVAGVPTQYTDSDTLAIRMKCPPPKATLAITGSVAEGATATITMTLDRAAEASVVATLAYSGTASLTDHDGTLTLMVPAGGSSATMAVKAATDALDEADETLTVRLAGVANGTIGSPSEASAAILDQDPMPTVTLTSTSVKEGDFGTRSLDFTVNKTGATARVVEVRYQAIGGTATVASDFEAASGVLRINPEHSGATLSVTVKGDQAFEADETVRLLLEAPRNATLVDTAATGTILNDDSAPPPPASGRPSDMDRDGLSDSIDNCMGRANADQADLDGDGSGDMCDADIDGDGASNVDEQAAGADARKAASVPGDRDGDRAKDATDNCLDLANAGQADADKDGVGDACEPVEVKQPVVTDPPQPTGTADPEPLDPVETPAKPITPKPAPAQPTIVVHPDTLEAGSALKAAYILPAGVTKARLELTGTDGTTFFDLTFDDGQWTIDAEAPAPGVYTTQLIYRGVESASYAPGSITVEEGVESKEAASIGVTMWGAIAIGAALLVLLGGTVVFLAMRK